MTRRDEIAHLFGVLGDTFARLAVLYRSSGDGERAAGGGEDGGLPPSDPAAGQPSPEALKDGRPRDGRALFLWAKGNGLLSRVESLGRSRRYARLAKDWTADQVADIYQAVTSKAAPGSYRQGARR